MNLTMSLRSSMAGLTVLLGSSAYAQETQTVLDQFAAGDLPIAANEIPLLIPFATEWDRMAATNENTVSVPMLEQYRALSIPDEDRLRDAMSALAGNAEAVDFFTNDETIDAFNQAYEAAKSEGSPIGMIPHDQAMRFWMTSRALTTGPEAMAAFPGNGPSVEWCLPPLILCNPPKPTPDEQ